MKLSSILVALDSSSGSKSMLKAAAELANRTQAELRALYVEDIDWFEASKYQFTQQISSYTGSLIPFSEKHIIEQSRALDVAFQKMFATISSQMRIKYSYHSVRGIVSKELLEAASSVDLVMLGRRRSPGFYPGNVSSTTRYLFEQSTVPLIIWTNGSRWPSHFIGICSTSPKSKPTMRWTFVLGRIMERNVHLFFPADIDLECHFQGKWNLEDTDDAHITIDALKSLSKNLADFSPETLNRFRDALFVIQRDETIFSTADFLESVSRPMLLL